MNILLKKLIRVCPQRVQLKETLTLPQIPYFDVQLLYGFGSKAKTHSISYSDFNFARFQWEYRHLLDPQILYTLSELPA